MTDLFPEAEVNPLEDAARILRDAIDEHKPSGIWVGVSGGSDSITALSVAKNLPGFRGILHLDTTIRIPEVGEFVRDLAKSEGIPLKEYRAPVAYDDIVMQHGSPGPIQHKKMYIRLKERSINRFLAEHKQHRKDRVMLVTGVRKSESKIRMGSVQEVTRQGCLVWAAPLANWTTDHKKSHMEKNGLKTSDVSRALCMSGECLCGAFARHEEMAELESVVPHMAKRIKDLMQRVKAAGKWWKWGKAPPTPPDPRQLNLDMHMCHSCLAKQEPQ